MNIIRQFFDEVVQPNMQAAMEAPGDLRAAVNAILTLDALTGVLYSAMMQSRYAMVAAMASDDKFRDHLADGCRDFRVLRDLAAAYKHGELKQPKLKQPRLVRDPKQVKEMENQLGIFECGDEIEGPVLMIEFDDGQLLRASDAIGISFRLLQPLVALVLT